MLTLLYLGAAIFVVWWLSKVFARSDKSAVTRAAKVVGGVVAAGAAVVLGLRGRIDMAILLAGLSAWLLGWSVFRLPLSWPFAGAAARVSQMRSAMIEVQVHLDTGALDGAVLAGSFTGKRLNELDPAALERLYEECRAADPDGLRLLEAYLDRRVPGWRQHAHADPDAGRARGVRPAAMTEEEAYQILGLQPGADADAVRRAHRALMKKLHPDQGGTTYLAARVNAAKEVLLSRHR